VSEAEEKNVTRRRRGFEALAVFLLSLATVGTAWCSYQASGWSTRSSKLSIKSAARGLDAATIQIKAHQKFVADMELFGEYFKAHNASNETLARFYTRKFGPELKRAHEAWLLTNPFENPDAPPNPFSANLYHPDVLDKADRNKNESVKLWYESGEAAQIAQHYTLISVLLTAALFFGGTAPQFESQTKRRAVLALGLTVLVVAAGMFLRLPKAKGGWFVAPTVSAEGAQDSGLNHSDGGVHSPILPSR
jgi:hypothetical protein